MKKIFYMLYDPIYDFLYRIQQTIKWLPIIWNDRQDDFPSIFILLRKKLQFMEKRLFPDPQVKRIRVCIMLLNRLIADEYIVKTCRVFTWSDKYTYDHADTQYSQDVTYLMYLLNKHIQYWWE